LADRQAEQDALGSAAMGKRDPRVDAYIEKAADFAKPILKQLRATVHQAFVLSARRR
jgi:hypothetical protein